MQKMKDDVGFALATDKYSSFCSEGTYHFPSISVSGKDVLASKFAGTAVFIAFLIAGIAALLTALVFFWKLDDIAGIWHQSAISECSGCKRDVDLGQNSDCVVLKAHTVN